MEAEQIYRMLAARQFDLLTEEEKQRLADSLEGHPEVDPVAFVDQLREVLAVEDGEETERDRAFEDALAAATHRIAATSRTSAEGRRAWGIRGAWRMSLAALAGAAAVWLLLGLPAREGPTGDAGDPVFLSGVRGGDGATVDIDASSAPNVTLIAEGRIDAPRVRWEVADNAGHTVDSGALSFGGDTTAARTIAISIEKTKLVPATTYWLVVSEADGTILRRWTFRVE